MFLTSMKQTNERTVSRVYSISFYFISFCCFVYDFSVIFTGRQHSLLYRSLF